MKLSFAIIVILSYLSAVRSDDGSSLRRPFPNLPTLPTLPTTGQLSCSAIYRCSSEEDPVWATDGYTCYVFINQCHLDLENCIREQAGIKPLRPIDKEKCQTLCNPKCPECDKPVCGIHDCKLLDFASLCWMDYFNCITGQVYTLNNYGPCNIKTRE